MNRILAVSGLLVLALTCRPAAARDGDAAAARPAVFQSVLDCRGLAEPGERLACFDRAVAALDVAVGSDGLIVADRERIRATRRGLFGLTLPRIELFGDGDEIDEIQSSVASASDTGGRWLLELADGARWRQAEAGFVNRPQPGQPVTITRRPLGNYMARVGTGRAFRVQRLSE